MAKVAIDHGSQLDLYEVLFFFLIVACSSYTSRFTNIVMLRDAGLKVEQSCYDQVLPTEDRIEGKDEFINESHSQYQYPVVHSLC